MRRWLIVAALLVPRIAAAHAADMIYASLSGKGDGALDELVTMTAATIGVLAPVDANGDRELTQAELDAGARAIEAGVWDAMPLTSGGAPCARSAARAFLREGYVELDAHFQCPAGELKQTFRLLSLLPGGYRVVLASDFGRVRGEAQAQGDEQTVTLPNPLGAKERVEGFFGWLTLGIFHILRGYDHLAFLLALLLVATGWRQVLIWITAFTVAHSLTLCAGALGWIRLDEARERWAEVAIAVSIVYVAVENLIAREQKYRAAVTFGFGLVHGLGFASALGQYGLGPSPVMALGGFNLGVELGQAALVGVLYPMVLMLRRRKSLQATVVRLGSAGIVGAGAFWMVKRLIG